MTTTLLTPIWRGIGSIFRAGLRSLSARSGQPALPSDVKAAVRAARGGHAGAQFVVAQAYLHGVGVPQNLAEGSTWLQQAAEGGHEPAQIQLATLLLQGLAGGKPNTLFAADQGQADPGGAFKWALQAAAAGQSDAEALVGFLYATGQGTEQDYRQAAAWYERAEVAGSPYAALGLGLIRLCGLGCDADTGAGVRLIQRASDAGIPTAIYVCGTLHEAGVPPLAQDEEVAVALYRRAAQAHVRPAQARLGLALLLGKGVPKNLAESETWLRRAAMAGDAEAAALVGDLHAGHNTGAPNLLEAATWYRLAAEGGHCQAARVLGRMYFKGLGVPVDASEAVRWLTVAFNAGDDVALADLAEAAALLDPGCPEFMRVGEIIRTRAEDGDPVAAYNLAVHVAGEAGLGAAGPEVGEWLRAAANHVVNAQYAYARLLLADSRDNAKVCEARQWLRKAADEGLPDAMVLLADLELHGRGGVRDPGSALRWLEAAAKLGHVGGMFGAAAILGGGHGVVPDRQAALLWFQQAARAGHPQAQYMAGRYIVRGLACAPDLEEGVALLEKAAAAGVTEATTFLSMIEKPSAA